MRLFRLRIRGLVHDDKGQVLLYGAVIAVVLLIFLLVIPNSTYIMTQKVRIQTAADAGAYTGSVWLARGLNLNASLNVGIKSMYTWMTVLTMASALAQALYSDTHDLSVRQMGQEITQALFDNSDPVYVAGNVYPQ
ncbi:MAG: pilus assembly protein TadG-related protein, partial [candidate division WOR-3 bacterium]